jgi:heat shock protein HslJ
MTSRRLLGAALLLLLPAACSGDPGKLVGHRWVLDPASIARLQVEVPAGTIVDLRFEEADLSGTSGCNRYGASYEAGNGSLDLGQIQLTMMACEDPALSDLEAAYLEAFATVGGWRVGVAGDERPSLTLTGDDGVELRYTAVDEAPQPSDPGGGDQG